MAYRHISGERECPVQPQNRIRDKQKADKADIDTPTSAPKRRRYDTPVRTTLVPTGSSPAAAASTYMYIGMKLT